MYFDSWNPFPKSYSKTSRLKTFLSWLTPNDGDRFLDRDLNQGNAQAFKSETATDPKQDQKLIKFCSIDTTLRSSSQECRENEERKKSKNGKK